MGMVPEESIDVKMKIGFLSMIMRRKPLPLAHLLHSALLLTCHLYVPHTGCHSDKLWAWILGVPQVFNLHQSLYFSRKTSLKFQVMYQKGNLESWPFPKLETSSSSKEQRWESRGLTYQSWLRYLFCFWPWLSTLGLQSLAIHFVVSEKEKNLLSSSLGPVFQPQLCSYLSGIATLYSRWTVTIMYYILFHGHVPSGCKAN